MRFFEQYALAFWSLSLEAAPWLVLGLAVAGLVKAWVPTGWMARWLGGGGFGAVTRAAVIGTPLPLCSCGVLPAAIGLHRQGASRGATVSFLVATPANGADSLAISYALLGPFVMTARLIAALVSALVAGTLAQWMPAKAADQATEAEAGGCCGGEPAPQKKGSGCEPAPAEPAGCCEAAGTETEPKAENGQDGCCGSAETASAEEADQAQKTQGIGGGLRYAFTDIFDDIKLWLLVGLAAAALVQAAVPEEVLTRWGTGWAGMGLMLLIGLPMYICATASVPVASALLLGGVGPGAVVVFLLAGPATNIGTVMALRKELGGWSVLGYLVGVCGGALVCGYLTEWLIERWSMDLQAQVDQAEHLVPMGLAYAALGLLVFSGVVPLRRRIFGS